MLKLRAMATGIATTDGGQIEAEIAENPKKRYLRVCPTDDMLHTPDSLPDLCCECGEVVWYDPDADIPDSCKKICILCAIESGMLMGGRLHITHATRKKAEEFAKRQQEKEGEPK